MFRLLSAVLTMAMFCSYGCNLSNQGRVRLPVAQLNNGEEIYIQLGPGRGNEPAQGPLAIWKHPAQPETVLVTMIPAPGSTREPDYSPTGIDIEGGEVRATPDHNRIWVVKNGRTVASFDYGARIAILGHYGQPDWASPVKAQTE